MSENRQNACPECEETVPAVDRRDFIRNAASLVAVGTVATSAPRLLADNPPAAAPVRQAAPAETLVQELYSTMTPEQRRTLVLPWDNAGRTQMVNAALNGQTIGASYTRPQQELIGRILRAICSDEEGYRRITRNNTFDNSGSLERCGSHIFGNPSNGQFSWVFSGHHLTLRCDNDPNVAWGGPMYYGHSPDGYSQRNCFYYQTQAVQSVWEALTEAQRRQGLIVGQSPGEQAGSVRFRAAGEARPGIAAADLTADQRRLVEAVMREVLSPYRREDADEVMSIIRRNGGLERINLAFYKDRGASEDTRWNFWRLEGPGFVWNYRVLPHVHTFVNIAAQA